MSAPSGDHGGLRGAVEALVNNAQAELFRDEAFRHVVKQPYADNRYIRLLDEVRAALAAHPEPEPAQDGEVGVCADGGKCVLKMRAVEDPDFVLPWVAELGEEPR